MDFGFDADGMARMGAPSDAGNDVLRFVDGSTLHGQLKELDFEHGLIWQNSAATAPIDFQAAHVDVVRFAHSSVLICGRPAMCASPMAMIYLGRSNCWTLTMSN